MELNDQCWTVAKMVYLPVEDVIGVVTLIADGATQRPECRFPKGGQRLHAMQVGEDNIQVL